MGYQICDNRVSGGRLEEYDTISCKHGQAVLRIIKGKKEGNWCGPCGGPICHRCARIGQCQPFLRQVDQQLAREQSLRSMGLLT